MKNEANACCANTPVNCLSRWLEYWFQKQKLNLNTYTKDRGELLLKLKALLVLSINAYLFTADANLVYTNTGTCHTLQVFGAWLAGINLPEAFPVKATKEAMELIIKKYILSEETCIFCSSLELQWVYHVPVCKLPYTLPFTK